MELPAWIPTDLPESLVSRVTPIAEALVHGGEPITLLGNHPGDRLALAAAVSKRLGWPTILARLAGCRSSADGLLLIGQAAGVPVPGSAVAVGAHLRLHERTLIILDDADVPGCRALIEQLNGMVGGLGWLCCAERVVVAGITETLPSTPLPDLDDLPERAGALALLPAGLPGDAPIPDDLLHPVRPGRQALRWDASLMLRRITEPGGVAERLLPLFEHVLPLAVGASLESGVIVEDLLAVRWLGEVLADPDDAARATAAAGRLLIIWGQLGAARTVLESGLRRNTLATPSARATLRWAEADALLASGARASAMARYEDAAALLRSARDVELLAMMTRRWADALAARGLIESSSQGYREAQALYRQLSNEAGVAATIRGTADLAVAAGELMSAQTLYDQADAVAVPAVEVANRRIGQAGLAMARGAPGRAAALLLKAEDGDLDLPGLKANLSRRQADLTLRRGEYRQAREHAADAIRAYARAGERTAIGHCTRLLGDIAAAEGRLAVASTHYQRTIALQIEVGDLVGLRRTLTHAEALESTAGDPERAERLRGFLAAL
ncbi:MAG: tetratricopeptide (TPR) repeat protein [Myxococcota bacterium]|jgi:tetratricopeptide (TPR) repeat protein